MSTAEPDIGASLDSLISRLEAREAREAVRYRLACASFALMVPVSIASLLMPGSETFWSLSGMLLLCVSFALFLKSSRRLESWNVKIERIVDFRGSLLKTRAGGDE